MEARNKGIYVFILAGLLVSVALALLVSPWASSAPDGLEKVAEDKGFLEKAEETDPAWESAPIPDYAVPGLTRETVDEETGEVVEEPTKPATALAGFIGTVAIFLIAWGLALVLKKKKPEEAGTAP
ncbi:MAG: PDGLE domain-containing protein [Actinobacteria bacterium]|nr:PDGLE domain-containing protein [Actinomycetota bacterium]